MPALAPYGSGRRVSKFPKGRGIKGLKRVSSKDVEAMLAKKVLRLERMSRARLPEEKFFDTILSGPNITDTAGAIQSVCSVAAGSDYNNRVGDTIRVHRIEGYVRIATSAASLGAAPTNEQHIRANLIMDTQQVADTAANPGSIWEYVAAPESNLLRESISHKRFKILATSQLWSAAMLAESATSVATLQSLSPTQLNTWNFDLKCNIRVSFNGTAGGDFEKNGLFVTWRTNIAADTVDSDGVVRIYYTDC